MIVDVERPVAVRMIEDLLHCFFCGDRYELPAITWAGSTGTIAMHPRCTSQLVLRLSRDLLETEHLSALFQGVP